MPVLESGEELLVGGQAVIEGVMMRAPHSYCVAVRRPDGSIAQVQSPIHRPSERRRIFKYPLFRGLGTLGQAMALGIKALRFSADVAVEAEAAKAGRQTKPLSPAMIGLNVAFSLVFFIVLYKFLPLFLVTEMQTRVPALQNLVLFNLADGLVRIGIFLVFLAAISRMKDIHRVFEYHGAEHKVVFNFESGQPVEVERARTFTTLHPRCGTSFLLVVMVISMLLYALVPVSGFWAKLAIRIALLPVIAGVSYEVIRFAAKRQGTLWASLVAPGLWLQKVTTQPPSDEQLAVSIHALEGAMSLEREQSGELVIA
jgi:uncharacterized protein YqhQ